MGIMESTASMKAWLPGHNNHKYESLPAHSPTAPTLPENHRGFWRRNKGCITLACITALVLVGVHAGTIYRHVSRGRHEMEDVSRLWGQYSPFYPVPSEIDPAIPAQCDVTFAQVLSRHGSRDPTAGKSEAYLELVGRIQDVVEDYGKGYEFIRDYDGTGPTTR
ncbi:Nod factor export ATP-binding protein I [Verticillium dahliae VDG1]|nr:Nod factor export ATP-binding protein I [Verticillium dahliae VDG1]